MRRIWTLFLVLILTGCTSVQEGYPELTKPIQITQVDDSELIELLRSDFAIIVYAIPDDLWSQIALPVLNESAQMMDITVYYYNIESDREKNSELYQQAYDPIVRKMRETGYVNQIYDILYVPTVIQIVDGEIDDYHIGTVPGHVLVDGEVPSLSAEQRAKLKSIYNLLLQ